MLATELRELGFRVRLERTGQISNLVIYNKKGDYRPRNAIAHVFLDDDNLAVIFAGSYSIINYEIADPVAISNMLDEMIAIKPKLAVLDS